METKCSVKELAKLCCGWNPESDVLPDPAAYHVALEKILRAVRVGDLRPIDLLVVQMTPEEFFYGNGPLFPLREAAAWAAKRFPAFPFNESDWLEVSEFTPAQSTIELIEPSAGTRLDDDDVLARRAEWFRALIARYDLKFTKLGISSKTAKKILERKPVTALTLDRLAQALKRHNVERTDIP